MQLTQPRGNFIEKIVRDGEGRLVRLSFCVYEENGHGKARLLNAVYLSESQKLSNKILALSGQAQSSGVYEEVSFGQKIVSPYFSNSNLLNFLGSKPRAPTSKTF